MESLENQISKKISDNKRGKIFFPNNFYKIGSPTAIRQALARLTKKGKIIRLAKGIYYYPKKNKYIGIVYPSLEEIANAIAKRDKARIIPTGQVALNKLGWSNQVPLNTIYLTDGSPRSVKIENGTLRFKTTSTKILSMNNQMVILITQALKAIGEKNIDENMMEKIYYALSKIDKSEIMHDLVFAPSWIANIFRKYISQKK